MMLNAGMRFSDSDIRTFTLMYMGGEKYCVIAAALGRSVKSIESMRRKLDLPVREKPAQSKKDKSTPSYLIGVVTVAEMNRAKSDRDAVILHLVDLMREYGGKNVGEAKAIYRQRNELEIPPGAERTLIIPSSMHISACSSAAGWMS